MRLNPRHVFDTVYSLINNNESAVIPEELMPIAKAIQKDYVDKHIEYAFELSESPLSTTVLDCLLLLASPYPEIEKITGINPETISWYHKIFFDTRVFRNNRIYKREYMDKIDHSTPEGETRYKIFHHALRMGTSYVSYFLGDAYDKELQDDLRNLFVLSYTVTFELSEFPWLMSQSRAVKWLRESCSAANLAVKKQSPLDIENLRIELTSEEFTEDKDLTDTIHS